MININDTYGDPIEYESFKFPGGEVNVRIADPLFILSRQEVVIQAQINSSDDLMKLLLVTDAIRQLNPALSIILVMPYLPYARQDRVMTPGEAMSLKVFTNIINSQKYSRVQIWDAHSDVGVALLDRCENVSQATLFELSNGFGVKAENTVLVSPDAGAEKKIYKLAKTLGINEVIRASKVREVSTGKISSIELNSFPEIWLQGGKDVLIADDICDGGGTFIPLAKALREKMVGGKIKLLVTHGIFSKGIEVFDGFIDEVLVINNIGGAVSTEKTKVISQ